MAARLTNSAKEKFRGSWSEQMRARIDTTILCSKLISHVKGELELSTSQIRAAEILLNKTLPNLASVDHSGEVTTPFVMRAPMPAETAETWEQQNAPKTLQ